MNPSTWILVLIQLATFVGLALFQPLLEPLNRRIRNLVDQNRNLRLRPLIVLSHWSLSLFALTLQLASIVLLLGLFWKDWRRAGILILALFSQLLVVGVSKKLTSVSRPPQTFSHFFLDDGSYPSGHSSVSMTLALLLPAILSPYLPLAALVAIAVYLGSVALITAYGRLFLDVHWLTDIIGGWMLSGTTFLLCRTLIR
jgi:undecaprenyl-diphosphatase